MYSNKQNVNILTSLLVAHQIRHAVVCPGSRNAPIVHNLHLCESIRCYPITDERSAGFFALGIAVAEKTPVVVCVTSGSALLNLAPAVAEAYYQHLPLIVISADRPEAWIGQLDGQTIRQTGVLGQYVNKWVSLPSETDSETARWYCNRLVNEALLAAKFPCDGPVHINIPIAEPLFDFSTPRLPEERVISRLSQQRTGSAMQVAQWWMEAKRPMVVIGQCSMSDGLIDKDIWLKAERLMATRGVWLSERLCEWPLPLIHVDEAITLIGDDHLYMPDLIVYGGGCVVSKSLKAFLRKLEDAKTVMLSPDGEICDVTMHTDVVAQMSNLNELMQALVMADANSNIIRRNELVLSQKDYHDKWQILFNTIDNVVEDYNPVYSQMATVRYFEQQLNDMEYNYQVHYANSSAIRLANIYADHVVCCNRGVNGIEGSLSTASGASAVSDDMVFCVIGDLSFFYDQNALWNQNLKGNLRILLLNNGEGGIFRQLNGLQKSEAWKPLVNGAHQTSAQGICTQNDVGYLHACDMSEMQMGIVRLLTEQTHRPILLEVFTDSAHDVTALVEYTNLIKKQKPYNHKTS